MSKRELTLTQLIGFIAGGWLYNLNNLAHHRFEVNRLAWDEKARGKLRVTTGAGGSGWQKVVEPT